MSKSHALAFAGFSCAAFALVFAMVVVGDLYGINVAFFAIATILLSVALVLLGLSCLASKDRQ